MKKRHGFTLVELLVAIAISTILIALVATTAIFLTNVNNATSSTATSTFCLRKVKDYIIENDIRSRDNLSYQNYAFKNGNTIIYEDLPFDNLNFVFESDEDVNYCTIYYSIDDASYNIKFVVSIGG